MFDLFAFSQKYYILYYLINMNFFLYNREFIFGTFCIYVIILVIYIMTVVVCIVSFNFGVVKALSEYYTDTSKSLISLSTA